MKKLLLFILGLVAGAFAAPCSPNLQEIYRFELGDVLQYQKEAVCGCASSTTWYLKRTVISKRTVGDTLEYRYHVKEKRIDTPVQGGLFAKTSYLQYEETQVIVDSSTSIANQCAGDTVPMVDANLKQAQSLFSVVQPTSALNTTIPFKPANLKSKTIGDSRGQLYELKNGKFAMYSPPPPAFPETFQVRFVESLGMVSWWRRTEGSESLALMGFIRHGDTSGVIWPDSDLEIPTTIHNPKQGIRANAYLNSKTSLNMDFNSFDWVGRKHQTTNPSSSIRISHKP